MSPMAQAKLLRVLQEREFRRLGGTRLKVYGPTYATRFNLYRAVQLLGGAAPGYSSGQALDALEEVAEATLPPDMGYEFADLSYQDRRASGTMGSVRGRPVARADRFGSSPESGRFASQRRESSRQRLSSASQTNERRFAWVRHDQF
jgi:AcrB/AcrD/AcrF family/Sigma-54 interaction domain